MWLTWQLGRVCSRRMCTSMLNVREHFAKRVNNVCKDHEQLMQTFVQSFSHQTNQPFIYNFCIKKCRWGQGRKADEKPGTSTDGFSCTWKIKHKSNNMRHARLPILLPNTLLAEMLQSNHIVPRWF